MRRFDLVGVDGNAFSIIAYTSRAMKTAGFSKEEITQYTEQATAGNYDMLLVLSLEWIDKCNEALGLEEDEDDYWNWDEEEPDDWDEEE